MNLFKALFVTAVFVVVAGCATHAGMQSFKAESGDRFMLTGSSQLGFVTIEINGHTVVDNISVAYPMKTKYKGHEVVPKCKQIHSAWGGPASLECNVFIDGEFAANLYFR